MPLTAQGLSFTPLHTSFTPTQSSSMLVTDTPVSRSLGATFSELIGQPTPPDLHVPSPSTVAPNTGTTEMLPSSVASSEPPASVIPTSLRPHQYQIRPKPLQRHFQRKRVIQLRAQDQMMMLSSSRSLIAPQRRLVHCSPTDRPLGFGV